MPKKQTKKQAARSVRDRTKIAAKQKNENRVRPRAGRPGSRPTMSGGTASSQEDLHYQYERLQAARNRKAAAAADAKTSAAKQTAKKTKKATTKAATRKRVGDAKREAHGRKRKK